MREFHTISTYSVSIIVGVIRNEWKPDRVILEKVKKSLSTAAI